MGDLETGALAVEAARAWIGTPFRHQGSCQGIGADCLGLVRGVWRALHGAEPWLVPAYEEAWAESGFGARLEQALGEHLCQRDTECRRPGDVLLFAIGGASAGRHLGILTRTAWGEAFVHAYTRHGVVESHLTTPWRRRVKGCFAFPTG